MIIGSYHRETCADWSTLPIVADPDCQTIGLGADTTRLASIGPGVTSPDTGIDIDAFIGSLIGTYIVGICTGTYSLFDRRESTTR